MLVMNTMGYTEDTMTTKSTIPPTERFQVRPQEAADLLSISTRHLRRLVLRGKLHPVGQGRGRRYLVEDLRAYLRREQEREGDIY